MGKLTTTSKRNAKMQMGNRRRSLLGNYLLRINRRTLSAIAILMQLVARLTSQILLDA
jgi:hypothetical protein